MKNILIFGILLVLSISFVSAQSLGSCTLGSECFDNVSADACLAFGLFGGSPMWVMDGSCAHPPGGSGACLITSGFSSGLCADGGRSDCEDLANGASYQYIVNGSCLAFSGGCVMDQFSSAQLGEYGCLSIGGAGAVWANNSCCMSGRVIAYGTPMVPYVTEAMCEVTFYGTFKGVGSTCTSDAPEPVGVPEDPVQLMLALGASVAAAGFFVYQRS